MEEKEKKRKRSRLSLEREEGVRGGYVSPPVRADDQKGHYVFDLGENLTPRFKILSKLGEGAFGKVVECLDRQTSEHFAVKIVRNIPQSREDAMNEIRTLVYVGKTDIGKSHFVQINSYFAYRSHTCIVFEKLGPSLFDFMKRNRYNPFPMNLVREFARRILESVAYLHDLHRIHTDLKPQNILLVSDDYVKLPGCKTMSSGEIQFRCLPKSSAIKLIDFGLTVHGYKDYNHIVSTRSYRAPEVILGVGWRYPCDLWSIGCILLDLISGETLFHTCDNLEHLAMMERVLGPLPEHMVQRATDKKYFKRGSRLNWPAGAASRERSREVSKLKPLKNLVLRYVDSSATTNHFADLLHGLLRLDPSERLTARQALARMKAVKFSLNANAASYIPLCERCTAGKSKDHPLSAKGSESRNATNPALNYHPSKASEIFSDHSNTTSEVYSVNGTNSHDSYASSSKCFKEVSPEDFLDEDADMDLAYLHMMFPKFSDESLSHIYLVNNGDLENTVDMLNQLELCTGDSPELPDTLEIGDTSESIKECASLKLKEVEGETPRSSLESTPATKVTAE